MKKKILFSLLSLVVCMFTMTACSNDDDNNNGTTSGLKLTSIVDSDGDKTDFTYDNQGRIKKLSAYYSDGSGSEIYDYTYQDNKIVVEETDNGRENEKYITEYTLKDGLIVEALDGGQYSGKCKYTYAYDKDRQLISIIEKESDDENDWWRTFETSINWKDGNIESFTEKKSGSFMIGSEQWQSTCQYTSEFGVKGLAVAWWAINIFGREQEDILFKLGYFGKQPKNLPSAIHAFSEQTYNDENGNPFTYRREEDYINSYGFEGKDGYVSSCTTTYKSSGSEETKTYISKFTWE